MTLKVITPELVLAMESAPGTETNRELAARLGVKESAVQAYRPKRNKVRSNTPKGWRKYDYVARDNADIRAKEQSVQIRAQSIRGRARDALRRARAAHDEAFNKPLIDASLLTPHERTEIRKDVINRQRWHSALWG